MSNTTESAAHALSAFVRTEFDKESDESWEKLNELYRAVQLERRERQGPRMVHYESAYGSEQRLSFGILVF